MMAELMEQLQRLDEAVQWAHAELQVGAPAEVPACDAN